MKNTFIIILACAVLLAVMSCKKHAPVDPIATPAKWKQIAIPYTDGPNYIAQIQGMLFTSVDTGYALGNHFYYPNGTLGTPFLRTTDGGETWTLDTIKISNCVVTKLESYGNYLYAIGAFNVSGATFKIQLYRSGDHAKTWQIINSTYPIGDIHFFDQNNATAISGDSTSTTNNGGINFSTAFIGPAVGHLSCIGNSCYVSGGQAFDGISHGDMIKTTNSGATWQTVTFNSSSFPEIVQHCFLDQNNGYALIYLQTGSIAAITSQDFKLIKTTDGGSSWTIVRSGMANDFGDIVDFHFLDNLNGYMISTSAIYSTSDGGANWQKEFDGSTYTSYHQTFFYLYFTPGNIGFAYGSGVLFKQVK